MTSENKDIETTDIEQAASLYQQMSTKEDELELQDIEEEEDNGSQTLEEREQIDSLTDMQTVIAKLFPEDLGDTISNKTMMGRIAPEVFITVLRLMTVQDIMQSPAEQPINVVNSVIKNYILLSVGLDGKGRIDAIEIAGASKANEELENMSKGLFG